ncbi:MAG: phosphoribosyl-ATP diphosphatase [Hyphomicrobium sp.]
MTALSTMERLAALIRERRLALSDSSYTRQLLDGGPEKCAKKFGEEAIETVIAAIGTDDKALIAEAADSLYHLVVLLEARGVMWSEVTSELDRRMGTSGLAEKASRPGGKA